MKNNFISKISMCFVFFLISITGFSVEYVAFYVSGTQAYCYNSVPTGTFQLELVNSVCGGNTYSWHYYYGGGWVPMGSSCVSTSITSAYSYPSATTTIRCTKNGSTYFYFTIWVANTPLFNVTGDDCCAEDSIVYLDSSVVYDTLLYTKYRLYRSGVYVTGSEQNGTGYPMHWHVTQLGTYTVKAHFVGCVKQMNGDAVISRTCCKGTTDVNNEILLPEIKIYPNPNSGRFTVESNNMGEYILFNEVGQEIQQIIFTSPNSNVEIEGLKPGIYFIRNLNGNSTESITISVVE